MTPHYLEYPACICSTLKDANCAETLVYGVFVQGRTPGPCREYDQERLKRPREAQDPPTAVVQP